jgi:type I restriction enzyme R subunit
MQIPHKTTKGHEKAQLAFVMKFRELLRLKNVLTVFSEYTDDDLNLAPQQFEDYKSKYLDLHDKAKKTGEGEKASILDDVDFELTLIHRDEINVAYILNLLLGLSKLNPEEAKKRQKEILDMIAGEAQLRSKRDLIKTFIDENIPKLKPNANVIKEFGKFWTEQQTKAFEQLCADEKIGPEELQKLLGTYTFANRMPRDQEIKESLSYKPKIGERKGILKRIAEKIRHFVDTFIEGMGGIV